MALYEITNDTFRQIEETSFSEIQVRERGDLQRLLRSQIDVLGDELYVLAEEFSDWEDSKRIRLKPYRDANQTMVDVQQVIPLARST